MTDQWGPESDAMVRRAFEPEWAQLEVTLDFRSLIEQQIARTAALRHTTVDARNIKTALLRYEADLANPVQSTTQAWGDGNAGKLPCWMKLPPGVF